MNNQNGCLCCPVMSMCFSCQKCLEGAHTHRLDYVSSNGTCIHLSPFPDTLAANESATLKNMPLVYMHCVIQQSFIPSGLNLELSLTLFWFYGPCILCHHLTFFFCMTITHMLTLFPLDHCQNQLLAPRHTVHLHEKMYSPKREPKTWILTRGNNFEA